jgi:hypothetical protein
MKKEEYKKLIASERTMSAERSLSSNGCMSSREAACPASRMKYQIFLE